MPAKILLAYAFTIAVLGCIANSPAWAWGDQGQEIIAVIAADNLSPDACESVGKFCKQLDYNLLFSLVFGAGTGRAELRPFDFLAQSSAAAAGRKWREFFRSVVEQARALRLLSSEHFTVDATLIEAWASLNETWNQNSRPFVVPKRRTNQTQNRT
jgi:hypothetical protein